ncbi:uncharacterized protein [Henckelia pumila]|uniref:uncharacterized protein n=1 Tax=Henckelia pumila TaxID=405737 RepID=UPI003C6E6E72
MRGRRPSAMSAYAASSCALFESGIARDDRAMPITVGFSSDAMLQSACLPICEWFPYEPPTFCCDRGKIRLVSPNAPVDLINLFVDTSSPMATTFRRKIRLYNSIFLFTSFGVRTDKSLAYLNRRVYTFRAAGQVFHTLPPLVPEQGRPKYFQLYFWDNDNELHNRISALNDEAVDEATMILLMNIMQYNPYAEILRRINEYSSIQDVRFHISKNSLIDQRCYNCPSADQVAAIWVKGNDHTNIPYDRDIVQHILKCLNDQRSAPPAQVVLPSKGLTSFDQIVSKESHAVRGKNNRMVSCREYYCYRLQIRENDSSLLLYGGRVASGETRGTEVGRRVVLPLSFIGGPRDMRKRYLDAMALVRSLGKSDLFITMTCNPEWPEIKNNLFDGQTPHDRPDLVSRVFRARYVSAEIPNMNLFPRLFELGSHHMMHGPCGNLNKKCPCMVNGQCKHHYPRSHSDQTRQGRDGYPMYQRRDNGIIVEARGCQLNSQWVVPYNPYLLYRYDCHINVEICSGLTAVKYLYKYIYKGHDKISVHVSPSSMEPYVDEIKTFQDARWVSAPENQNLQNVLNFGYVGKTMLTEYFSTCCANIEARQYLYSEFPCHFVWDSREKSWNRRKQGKLAQHFVLHSKNHPKLEVYWSAMRVIFSV